MKITCTTGAVYLLLCHVMCATDAFIFDTFLHMVFPGSDRVPNACFQLPEYHNLRIAASQQPCMPATKVWGLLGDLIDANQDCFGTVMQLAATVEHDHHNCTCTGHVYSSFSISSFHDVICSVVSSDFPGLRAFFTDPDCGTHAALWRHLDHLKSGSLTNALDCLLQLVKDLAAHFKNGRMDDCVCTETSPHATTHTSLSSPTTTTSTTATTTATTTPFTSTTTTLSSTSSSTASSAVTSAAAVLHPKYARCEKLATVQDIAQHQMDVNSHTVPCPSGTYTSSEAFVIDHCNIHPSSTWASGENVMISCADIPTYTPIATFYGPHYNTSVGLSGVLVGCLPNGFRMVTQHCDHTPVIERVETGSTTTNNAYAFYTIQ